MTGLPKNGRIVESHEVLGVVRKADIVVCGEAPGINEIQRRTPFIGSSGDLLNSWLTLQGIPRSSLFITNVIGDRISKTPTAKDRELLFEEIKFVRPKVIAAVGEVAMNTLTRTSSDRVGKKGITKWRGSRLWSDDLNCSIIPIIHPAAVMRNWGFWPLCVSDVGKLKKLEYIKPSYNFIEDARETDLFDQFKEENEILCLDVETVVDEETGYYSKLIRLGLGNGKIIISIPVKNFTVSLIKYLHKLLNNPKTTKIAHNSSYDFKILLWNLKFLPSPPWFDTILAAHALQPELPKALEVVASLYLDPYEYWKQLKKETGSEGYYNCLDVDYTIRLYHVLRKELYGTN